MGIRVSLTILAYFRDRDSTLTFFTALGSMANWERNMPCKVYSQIWIKAWVCLDCKTFPNVSLRFCANRIILATETVIIRISCTKGTDLLLLRNKRCGISNAWSELLEQITFQ